MLEFNWYLLFGCSSNSILFGGIEEIDGDMLSTNLQENLLHFLSTILTFLVGLFGICCTYIDGSLVILQLTPF